MPWLEILLVLALVLLNGAFSGSEMALVSLREGQLNRMEQQGERARRAADLARDPNQFLSTIQIGITLAGFLASAFAAVSLAEPLVEPLGFLGGAAETVSVALVTIVISYFSLVLGELAPKRLAMQRAEGWAILAGRPLARMSAITRPAVWLLGKSTNLVVRVLGADPNANREEVTEEEIKDLIASQDTITDEQRTIIEGAFEVAERRIWEVVVPRQVVFALQADEPAEHGLRALVDSGHSRCPVHRGDLDDLVGVVHLRDLVAADGTVGDHARAASLVPDSLGVLEALRTLRESRSQLAVVFDEHGSNIGLVTVEDLLEEVVGEIYDEFDPDLSPVAARPDGSIALPGSFPVHDLVDVGISVPEGPYATVAGLVLANLGHLASEGERVRIDGWDIEVVGVSGRAIAEVCFRPRPDEPEDGGTGALSVTRASAPGLTQREQPAGNRGSPAPGSSGATLTTP